MLGRAEYILQLYGIRSFLDDLEQGRQYWRESDSIVAQILDWAATEGFDKLQDAYVDAQHYRQRHILRAIELKRF